jgi:TRAP-type C4-dicarboxylate transport system permease small subunit
MKVFWRFFCYEVVMRYFFMIPSLWVVQTCEYALLWIVFLGATRLLSEQGLMIASQ